ncbi:MAG: peptidoglycan DD-metalloendopeptidase family protein [bacterium]|nr:peptidoglycan DD-metalloendopeptidase family protein [bacterium]
MKKVLFVIFFIVVGLTVQPYLVYSENNEQASSEIEILNKKIAENKSKVQKLEASIEQVKKDINSKKLEATSLKNQIAILDNRTTQIELDIEVTEEKLDTLTLEISALKIKIDLKEKDIVKQKEMLSELIRTLNYESEKDYLEVIAAYDNFSDFYNRVQYLQVVEEDLGKNTKTLRLAKEELDEKKSGTEERKLSYETMKAELDEKMKNYEEQIFNKENLLFQTKSSEITFQALLKNLRSQYQQIEAEIASVEREMRNKLEAQKKFNNTNDTDFGGLFSWPTQSRYVTAYFRDPDYPFRNIFEHNAIDIRSGQGTPIKAAASGYVGRARTCSSSSCYAYVMLLHADNFSTLYGHLSKIIVSEDQFVTRGDIIGYSGATPGTIGAGPFVTGPHLHFEIRKNGIPTNPLNYLVKDW